MAPGDPPRSGPHQLFPAGPGSRPGLWGRRPSPAPFPSLRSSAPLGHRYRPIPPSSKHWAGARKCLSTLLPTEQEVYTASNGRRAHPPGACTLQREAGGVRSSWGAEHRRGPGVQGWGLLCPSPLSQSPVCICSPSSQHQGPSGLTDSDTWLQTEKADCQGLGTFWEAPNGRAMQSPGLAAKWPSPSGWQGVQHSRDATRLCGPGTGWSGQLVCYSCSGNSAREGRRRSDDGALEPLAH